MVVTLAPKYIRLVSNGTPVPRLRPIKEVYLSRNILVNSFADFVILPKCGNLPYKSGLPVFY